MSSSVQADNKEEEILILYKGSMQRLDDTTSSAKKEYIHFA